MRLSITLALVATTVTTSAAYSNGPIAARNDLDLTPDDMDVLFGRGLVDTEADEAELLAREFDLDLEDEDFLFKRAFDTGDPETINVVGRDLGLDSEDLALVVRRASPNRSPKVSGSSSNIASKLKNAAGACFGCASSSSAKVGKGVEMVSQKSASLAKSAAKGTGNFLKEGLTGPGAEYMQHQMPYMDPVGMMMGAHTHSPVSSSRDLLPSHRTY